MTIESYKPEQLDELEQAWKQLKCGKDMTSFQKFSCGHRMYTSSSFLFGFYVDERKQNV